MKVLIAVHYFPPHIGGIEIVAQNQAKYLVKHGHEVEVLTSAINSKKGQYLHGDNYKVHRMPAWNYFEKKLGVPFPIYSLKLVSRSFKLVRKADIVHIHDTFYLSSLVTAFWAWVLNKPIFLTQHVSIIPHDKKIVGLLQNLVYSFGGYLTFHKAKRIIVFNGRVKSFLIERNVAEEKIITIYNGTDLELFHPVSETERNLLRKQYNLPKSKTLALFVGRFVHKKGFDKLIEASSEDYIIVFAGGPAPEKYKNDNHYIFVGELSHSQLADIYKACDVFVLPSEGEGFPLSIQEAMASGLPIITTADEGYSIHNFNHSLFKLIKPTVEQIKNELTDISQDLGLRERMSAYSVRYATKHFSWNSTIEEIANQYQRVIK